MTTPTNHHSVQQHGEAVVGEESPPLDELLPAAAYISRFCRRQGAATDFRLLIADLGPLDDNCLCEAIEADGRNRITFGMPVRMERYLAAVDDLLERRDPLDAAVDVTLRSISRSARISAAAVETLAREYPHLEKNIREAAMLNNALWSTSHVRRGMLGASRPLPQEFGPSLPGSTGESRYELRQFLGKGSSGQVYLAVDRLLSEHDRPALVAIKILHEDKSDRAAKSRRQLTEEATKARRIDHPNIVRVIDRGVSCDNEDFITYEFVSGGDLYTWLSERGRLAEPHEAARLVAQVAGGVQAAHAAGLVHCDLQPANILLTPDGVPKVADFGVAIRAEEMRQHRLRRLGIDSDHEPAIGSKPYVSPEQLRGEEGSLTVPSDVYALGSILFFLLTGQSPNGATVREFQRMCEGRIGPAQAPRLRTRRPEVDRDLEAICGRALALQPQDRYTSAGALAEDLESWCRNEPIRWTRPSTLRVLRLWTRRKPALATISALLILSVVMTIGLVIHGLRLAADHKAQELRVVEAERDREVQALRAAEAERERESQALRAEIDRMRAQEFESAGRRAAQMIAEFVSGLHQTLERRASTQFLTVIWVIDQLFDRTVLGTREKPAELLKLRFEVLEQLVRHAEAEGREQDVEVMLLRTALAFALVSAGDRDSIVRAEKVLGQLNDDWSSILRPEDRWMGQLNAIEAAAAVRSVALEDSPLDASRRDALTVARRTLEAQESLLARDDPASPLHFLVLEALIELTALLDDSEAHALAAARHASFAAPPRAERH